MFCQADTETYVHRSGRTGRAFTKGTCITLYTKQQVRPAFVSDWTQLRILRDAVNFVAVGIPRDSSCHPTSPPRKLVTPRSFFLCHIRSTS